MKNQLSDREPAQAEIEYFENMLNGFQDEANLDNTLKAAGIDKAKE